MQYIIMSDGKGTRWNNYLGITKQEALINNERIIDRTVRLIRERTNDKIYILSSNENHESNFTTRIVSKYDDYYHKKYAYDYLNDETTYLYGDTVYTDKLMNIIINDNSNEICFYGNESAIVGVKVKNYKLLKNIIDNANPDSHSLYHQFDSIDNLRSFYNVGDSFVNINNGADYEELISNQKTLLLKYGDNYDRKKFY